ncbi:MAG: hypothetical protein ACO1N9_04515 [Flavobacterium sp.]
MMKYSILALLFMLFSCSQKEEIKKDENLLGFKATFLAELGDDKYDSLLIKTSEKPVVKYVDDVIFITLYAEMNACEGYEGKVQVKNDSIVLGTKSLSDEVCTSNVIDKLSYIIDNTTKKKYKFRFQK